MIILVIAKRTCQNLLPSHSELCTARRANDFRNIVVVEEANPSTRKCNLSCASVHLTERLHLIWTPGAPVAPEIDVPHPFQIVQLQSLDGQRVVLFDKFDMRADAVGMEEDHIFREIVVVVRDVLEVDIAFFALVHLDLELCIWIVDHVDCVLPSMIRASRQN